ncbi:MAG: prepilin-type N-terminal cleavage/methylation domain-containing protein [Zoogloeaceae bacterium]|jgi:prepilin-type N-terminal cleavage/methylation domain-containing protein|nr:prepilin-type N-terminal cleavage/methylation domain-containing protein [Zoogloeaceae bacterium]
MRLNAPPSGNAPSGFTLLELALVLFILALLLGSIILPLAAQREIRQWQEATNALTNIQSALLGYAALHDHLPCPDMTDDSSRPAYGVAPDDCAAAPAGEGFLPFKSLGLENGLDPWGRRWRYRVDRKFADASAPITLETDFSGADRLLVLNLQGEKLTTSEERPVAILYSLGANGKADGDNAYFEASDGRYQSGTPTPEFDDIMIWLARPVLARSLLIAGRLR